MTGLQVTVVAPVNPSRTLPGGIRSYVLGLVEHLASAGVAATLVGIGPPTRPKSYEFISALQAETASSGKFHLAVRRLIRKAPRAIRGIIHTQRPDDLAPFRSRALGDGCIVTIHGDPLPGIHQRHGRLVAAAYRRLESVGVQTANRVLFVDRESRKTFAKRYPQAATKFGDTDVAVDLEKFRPVDPKWARERWKLDAGPHVLFAGRIAPEKNLSLLASAIHLCRERPSLLLASSPDIPASILSEVRKVPHRLLGVVSHEMMPSLYAAAAVTALPSIREAMPMTCLESLACGTPVVATPTGRLPDIIFPGRNGALAAAEPFAFARALDDVLRKTESVSAICRDSVAQFGWDQVVPSVLKEYRSLK